MLAFAGVHSDDSPWQGKFSGRKAQSAEKTVQQRKEEVRQGQPGTESGAIGR